ncbi:MAG: CPBP family intramembrane metalloprotease [Bacillota bacterium]|nr:CPBP family intramembrane metalloprotease [Bacillota bacterium]
MTEKKYPFKTISVYCLIFYISWTLYELYGSSAIGNMLGNEWISQIVKSGLIKNLVWTLPAWLLARHYQPVMYVKAKEMFRSKLHWQKYLPIYAAFVVYLGVGDFIINGSVAISPEFNATQLITVLFVGITEEMVFRGWLLNATITEKRKWSAILINAAMFLLIHFPRWFYDGIFITSFTSLGFISILALSVIFSWTFIKSKNLLLPITLHMLWDLLMFLLY